MLSDDASSGPPPYSLSFPLFILETRVKLERQMFLFARPCRMTCSFRRLLPFLPPYRVTAGLAGHCGRLRKRRGKRKRRLRIKWRRIPGGAESHLLTQFQMTLLGSVIHGRQSLADQEKQSFLSEHLSAHALMLTCPKVRFYTACSFQPKAWCENMNWGP